MTAGECVRVLSRVAASKYLTNEEAMAVIYASAVVETLARRLAQKKDESEQREIQG